jgi:hemoglobin
MKNTKRLAACLALAYSVAAPAWAQSGDLYAALGKDEGIRRIVVAFVARAQADPRVKEQFKDADLDRLHRTLAEQFCVLAGGPCKYTGQDMRESHADMKVTNAQFNAVAEDLQLAMEQQGVPSAVQNRLIAKLAPMQRDIVTK